MLIGTFFTWDVVGIISGHLVVCSGRSCATLITLSRCSGNATFLNPTLRTSQLTENHGGLRVQLD